MAYIGNTPTTAAFPFDQFSGTGAATSFTLTYAPASATSILVAISGVMQNPNLYSVIGTTLSFSPAPPAGTNNISVLYLGLPVIGSSSPGNTAFLSATDLTATAGQTVFASAGSYTPGFVQVYRNGARLGNADFTATNGTTITLTNAATAGDLVTIEYYTLTSLVNALPLTGGTVTGSTTFNTGVNLAAVSGNVGVGTSSPTQKLHAVRSGGGIVGRFDTTTDGITDVYGYGLEITRSVAYIKGSSALHLGSAAGYSALVLDSSGRVTTPFQPAFSTGGTGSGSKTAGTVLGFTTSGPSSQLSINVGSGWSNANSRFTAPVAGIYVFTAGIYAQNTNANNTSIAPCVNGAQLTTGGDTFMGFLGTTGTTDTMVMFSFILNLAVNDFIDLRIRSGAVTMTYYAGHSYFQGYLLG